MNPNAEAIYLKALGLDPAQREAYLDEECGEDAALRGQVEGMLAAEGEADRYFESEAVTIPSEPSPRGVSGGPSSEEEGDHIGRYKLLQKIGEGGFGVVWMAEQTEPVTRRVALKVIKMGMDTREVVARFEAERQALAMMEHPNIAKVLDAGATGAGRPYFVMELVRGVAINQFCDEKKLGVRERLELFVDVCGAIGHAHQKGIIHRDLKPSNILVTLHGDQPVPKVIDFGIAKATQQKLTDKTLFTRFEQFVGTPVYMSPEQTALSGLDIDTRSDIYSLGVLLYELLAGRPPFDARSLVSAGYDEMRRIIREEEPPKPSTRLGTLDAVDRIQVASQHHTDPERLHRLVRGDLDWIVMKAIEKDRARRYETASALVEDLRRHLASEPVSAGPPGARYRMGKFVRRNRAALGVAAVVTAVLLAGTAVSVWQAVRATQARDRLAGQVTETERERRRAEANFLLARKAVDDYLRRVANDPRLARGMLPLREQLLKDALGYYEKFLESEDDDGDLTESAIHAAFQVALIQNLIGSKEMSLKSYARAVALIEASANRGAPEFRGELAACHYNMAFVHLDFDRYAEAEDLLEKAIAIRSELHRSNLNDEHLAYELAAAYNGLGVVRTKSYRAAEALDPLNTACGLVRSLVTKFPERAEYQSRLGAILNNLADANRLLAKKEDTEQLLREAIVHQERAVEMAPEIPGYLEFLANHLFNLGVAMADRHDPTSGDVLERARRERERLVQSEPSVTQWQLDLARTYIQLGNLPAQAFTRSAVDSQRMFEQAIAILERLLALTPDWNNARAQLAQACHRLARIHLAKDRPAPALERWREAVEHSGRLVSADPVNDSSHRSNLARSLYYLGYLQARSGQAKEALDTLTRSRNEYERLYADGSREPEQLETLARCYNNLGLLLVDLMREDEARAAYKKGVALCRRLQDEGKGGVANLIQLGGICCNQGHLFRKKEAFEEAVLSYGQAESALLEALASEPENSTAAAYWYNTASGILDALEHAGRIRDGLDYCKRAQKFVPPKYAPTFKLRLAYFAARAGEHSLSAGALAELSDVEFDEAAVLNIAGIYAINAGTVGAEKADLHTRYQQSALQWLEKRLARGDLERRVIEEDKDFDSLRKLEAFRQLMDRVR